MTLGLVGGRVGVHNIANSEENANIVLCVYTHTHLRCHLTLKYFLQGIYTIACHIVHVSIEIAQDAHSAPQWQTCMIAMTTPSPFQEILY